MQEELTARVAEETNKNLYIVSLFTALLLPPTLITGIFATCTINLSRFDYFDHPCQRDSAILYPLPGCTVEGDCC